jgi:DNA-binding CsgD family transcriptional regulator/PAS domain-containing protein
MNLDFQSEDIQSFSKLIGCIYQGALEETPWQTFMSELRELMGAHITTLVLIPPSQDANGVMLNIGGNIEGIDSYNSKHYALDPFIDLPVGEVISLREFLAPDKLDKSEFYKTTLKPAGIDDILGADLEVANELSVRVRVSRFKGSKPFGNEQKALMKVLLPHLERALLMHARLNKVESELALYAGAMEQLSVGTVILDENGNVINCNAMAKQLIDAKDGLLNSKGTLHLANREQTSELQKLVSSVLETQRKGESGFVEAMRATRPSGLSDLGLVIRPVPTTEFSEGKSVPSVAIFISDPEQTSETPVQVITRLFGVTPAEASLAMLLVNGLTLDEAAKSQGVSRNTTRTHLRSIFAKTGVSRQTMLVRLILKSVATLA